MNFYDLGDGLNYTDDDGNIYLYGQTYTMDDGSSLVDGQIFAAADDQADPSWFEKGIAGVKNDPILQKLYDIAPALIAML
jgi:hypothetical protein